MHVSLFQLVSLVEDLMTDMQALKDQSESLRKQLDEVSAASAKCFGYHSGKEEKVLRGNFWLLGAKPKPIYINNHFMLSATLHPTLVYLA